MDSLLFTVFLVSITLQESQANSQLATVPMATRERSLPDVIVTFAPHLFGKIGVKRAGLLCLPADVINGASVYRSLRYNASTALGFALSEQNRKDLSAYNKSGSVHELHAEVLDLKVKVCARNWGLGDRTSVVGNVRLGVRWTARRSDASHSLVSARVDSQTDWSTASGSVIDLVDAAFEESARRFVVTSLLGDTP